MTVWCFGPRHTPVEALDLGTGYEIAAAALRGLTKRLRNGAGSTVKVPLARTALLIIREVHDPTPDRSCGSRSTDLGRTGSTPACPGRCAAGSSH